MVRKNPATQQPSNLTTFLLEIGTEEVPAADLDSALKQLHAAFVELGQKQNLAIVEENIEISGTPRRMAVTIKNFPNKQADVVSKKVKGPPAGIAFKDGKPTGAAIGFAKSQGIKLDDIIVEPTEKGEYIFAATTKKGRPSAEILKTELPAIIGSIEFKKAMRWSDSARFIRPIRWLVALHGNKVIPFSYGDVIASNTTFGHRLLAPAALKIKNGADYQAVMNKAKVMVSGRERAKFIGRYLNSTSKGYVDLSSARIQKTLGEVVNLVENPSVLTGSFDEKFLKLPRKVIETVLQSHQRYFPILESKQVERGHPFKEGVSPKTLPKLTNYFVVIHNGDPKYKKLIQRGHQKVVKARLEDAQFYIEADSHYKISGKIKELTGIVFHEGLGNLLDKTKRLQFLTKQIASGLELNRLKIDIVQRAAYLSKADLLTSMVGEFDELQGAIGAEYAKRDGEKKEVAQAIGEQYLPKHAKDELPKSISGRILSIADRIDTLCAYISIGILPSSAGDPYALRRQSTGLVDILFDSGYKLSAPWLTITAYKRLAKDFSKSNGKSRSKSTKLESEAFVVQKALEHINQRIEFRLSKMGADYDIIRAVAELKIEQPVEIKIRTLALQNIRKTDAPTLSDLVTAFNRAYSIADPKAGTKVSTKLLQEKEEKDLYKELLKTDKKIDEVIAADNFKQAIKLLASLRKILDVFFDKVLVNAEVLALKKNRHALLNNFTNTCLKVADLSKIVK